MITEFQNIKLSRGEFMEQSKHLNGYIYHMVHIDNLPSIFRLGALLSKEVLKQVKIDPRSIAHETVQDIRERIFIWSPFEKRFRSLHSYIPFYFAVRPPMLHVQKKRGIQDEIVIFAVHHTILREPGVLYRSDFFCGVELLDKLNWFAINGGYIEDWDEHERLMSAEVICL